MSKTYLVLSNSSSGLYDFRGELLQELQKDGTVLVSVPMKEKSDDLRSIGCTLVDTPIDRRGINPIKDVALLGRYYHLIRSNSPDLVISYTIKPNIYGGFAARLIKVPYVSNITGLGSAFQKSGLLQELITIMYRVSLKKAKCVFFENSGNCVTLLRKKVVTKKQAHVLNGAGVNITRFSFKSYPSESPETRFLFIGRVMKEKGIDELFYSMRKLNNDGYKCTLDILGYYEDDYESQIEKYEKEGWLHYHGYQLDVRPFIEKAHCFVLPSYHEGMANTLLECGAMGRPLITSNIHGCKEAVLNNESGYLCEVCDGESLYNAMKRFVEIPYGQKAQMGRISRQYIASIFDKRIVVEETVKMIRE